MAKSKEEVKAELEQKLGQLVMRTETTRKALQKLQEEVNDTATAIEKLDG